MTSYLQQYRPFLLFLGKFFLAYMLLTLLYQLFLSQYDAASFEPDGMTYIAASNSRDILSLLGYDVAIAPHPSEPSYKFFFNGESVARIIEGCNAANVIILYISFLLAFSGSLKQTMVFVFGGILVIHILNVARIAALILGLVFLPQHEHLMHDILFPLFIYGVVFLLWFLWIRNFSRYAKKSK